MVLQGLSAQAVLLLAASFASLTAFVRRPPMKAKSVKNVIAKALHAFAKKREQVFQVFFVLTGEIYE
jgi:hypothetical protein